MTTIIINTGIPNLDGGIYPANARVSCVPTKVFEQNEFIVMPKPVEAVLRLVDNEINLLPSTAEWYWKITITTVGVNIFEGVYSIPNTTNKINLNNLTQLYKTPAPEWQTQLNQLIELGGIPGEPGYGESAYDLAVQNGYNGTVIQWLSSLKGEKGSGGYSAYQVALINGFTGNQSEWLESLKGDPSTIPGPPGAGVALGAAKLVADAPSTYPQGIYLFQLTGPVEGWPTTQCVVETVKRYSTGLVRQTLTSRSNQTFQRVDIAGDLWSEFKEI